MGVASTLTTTTFANDTDPHFRTWVAAFIAAIVAGGWVQTGDTGQINTGTVLAPVALNTSAGYAIFRSNDAGGGLVEFYLKIEFGSGAGSATRPSLWVTFGFQGTDGAGNLLSTINPISTRTQIAVGSNPAGASQQINFASGSGYICICVSGITSTESIFFSVERTKNASLVFTNQILIIGSQLGTLDNSANNAYLQVINTANAFVALTQLSGGFNFAFPATASTPVAGVVALGLVFGNSPGGTSPSINLFGQESGSLGIYGDVITVPVLGVNHSYKIQRGITMAGLGGAVLPLTRYE